MQRTGTLHSQEAQYNVFRRRDSLNMECPAQTYVLGHLLPSYEGLWGKIIEPLIRMVVGSHRAEELGIGGCRLALLLAQTLSFLVHLKMQRILAAHFYLRVCYIYPIMMKCILLLHSSPVPCLQLLYSDMLLQHHQQQHNRHRKLTWRSYYLEPLL